MWEQHSFSAFPQGKKNNQQGGKQANPLTAPNDMRDLACNTLISQEYAKKSYSSKLLTHSSRRNKNSIFQDRKHVLKLYHEDETHLFWRNMYR
jgi:hypothetical protein